MDTNKAVVAEEEVVLVEAQHQHRLQSRALLLLLPLPHHLPRIQFPSNHRPITVARSTFSSRSYSSRPTLHIHFLTCISGLPAYHPLVGAQGFNQTAVDLALYNISNAIVQAGYNLKIAFLGPERPLSDLEQSITEEYGVNFDGAIIGAGIRASVVPQLIVQFEDMLETIGTLIPDVRFLFNGNVESTLPAIQRVFPINETCTTPGKAYVSSPYQLFKRYLCFIENKLINWM